MSLREVFITSINKGLSIQVDNPVVNPQASKNFQKTKSNINQAFKFGGIWNDQIDDEIFSQKVAEDNRIKTQVKVKGQIIKCPCFFVEFIPNDGNQILGGVTQYMDACLYFHIFSDELNTPNNVSGVQDSGDQITDNYSIYDLRDIITTNFLGFHPYNGSALMSRYDDLDYKHGTITKYLRGFHFCWNDNKGSIFDPKSSRYLVSGTLTNGTLNPIPTRDWMSGNSYVAFVNTVFFSGIIQGVLVGYYLALVSNSDAVFTPEKWQYLELWTASTAYTTDSYVMHFGFAYKCNTDNSDSTFTPSKWDLITRI